VGLLVTTSESHETGQSRRLAIPATDAELAGHAHKLEVELQRLCGSGFSLFAVCMLAKPYHFGVN